MVLEKLDHRRAGEVGRLEIAEVQWPTDGRYPGHAEVRVDGQAWSMLDYREEVPMSDELAALVKVPEPQDEKRQCVTRVLAAGVLQRQLGRPPNQEEVSVKAEEMRKEHCYQALDAAEQLGEAEEFVAAVEHELRTYVHDILTPHHEKDFRSLAVFPLSDLQEAKVVVLRADYRGDLLVETVVGPQWRAGGWHVWALIARGHMTLLQPPASWDAAAWLRKEERFSTLQRWVSASSTTNDMINLELHPVKYTAAYAREEERQAKGRVRQCCDDILAWQPLRLWQEVLLIREAPRCEGRCDLLRMG